MYAHTPTRNIGHFGHSYHILPIPRAPSPTAAHPPSETTPPHFLRPCDTAP
ncbi:MAG: hypothetical protein OJF49_000793 [Ktedonobacterales bacterium]|nr:MAG: hypothetical protein OJF49_000793 [Ktedonobacterales bacterium]